MTAPAAPSARHAVVPRVVGLVLALVLVAAGVVAAREALAASSSLGLRPSQAWLPGLLRDLDGRPLDGSAVAAGALVLVVGVLVLVAAWHRGPSDARVLDAPAVRLGPQDLARVASAAAEDVDGVLRVTSTASARSVHVRVESTGSPGVDDAVRGAVEDRLGCLGPAPRVRVTVTGRGAAR